MSKVSMSFMAAYPFEKKEFNPEEFYEAITLGTIRSWDNALAVAKLILNRDKEIKRENSRI